MPENKEQTKINETPVTPSAPSYPVTGRLSHSETPGEILVEINGSDPQPARILSNLDRKELTKKENTGREVLIVFQNGDLGKPIITGMIESVIDDIVAMEFEPEPEKREPVNTVVDGKKITLEAENEIVLKCGKGSITIQKDGKIVVKGTNLLSRSSGVNRIKGGSVGIN